MGFINECSTIIRRSKKDMFNFHLNKNFGYDYFDKNENLISSNTILNQKLDFTKYYLTLDYDDSLYGVYIDNGIKLININQNSSSFSTKNLLTYNNTKFDIAFPYIKRINIDFHLLYYVYSNNYSSTCALIHHHNHNGMWTENKIDFIDNIVLNNFCVLWTQDCPIVFYLKLINNCEEVFLSRYNVNTLTWSKPIQITNSKKNKIYLSVLKDSMNFYHISFCENVDNAYAVKYINGYLMENKLDVNVSKYITGPSSCMYPNIIKHQSDIYLMWVNYNRLYTVISKDFGKSWSECEIDEFSMEEEFTRSMFFSNYQSDKDYKVTSVFTTTDTIGIIGF